MTQPLPHRGQVGTGLAAMVVLIRADILTQVKGKTARDPGQAVCSQVGKAFSRSHALPRHSTRRWIEARLRG